MKLYSVVLVQVRGNKAMSEGARLSDAWLMDGAVVCLGLPAFAACTAKALSSNSSMDFLESNQRKSYR